MNKPCVYLIGAGPGDKDLITVKGRRLLSQADVVMYDHLIALELLSYAKVGAQLICVGKRAAEHTLPQEAINALLVAKAREGHMVARLKGGDCYLFGRGGEEAQACAAAGVSFEVVPGVTSALAAGGYAGIPATHRDYTSDVAIVTGHRKADDDRPLVIPRAGTLIFMMSVTNIESIIQSMLATGYSAETKIAAVERGTCYDQRVIEGTLETFLTVIRDTPLRTPAIFIAGKVVELRAQLDWFSKRPVILHLGMHPERYEHLGTIVHRPIIRCVEMPDDDRIQQTISKTAAFDWIVFTSGNGVTFFFNKLYHYGLDARCFAKTKFAVIGQATAAQLREFGIKADVCPAVESSRGLLDTFEAVPVAGLSILLPQAKVSATDLARGLTHREAAVQTLAVYETVEQPIEEVDLAYIDQVLFTSGSTVRAFVNKFGTLPEHLEALCLGEPTQAVAKDYHIDAKIIEKDTHAES